MECVVLWHRAIPVLDEQEDPGSHGEWTDDVTESARAAGGSVWLRVGSTLAIVFEMHDIKAALDWGLETLQRADQVDHSVVGMRIAFGVAVGEVDKTPQGIEGSAFDRAQLLANRARFGEIVLDPGSQAIARETFLFARTVHTGSAGLRGDSIDRRNAHVADCREGLKHLHSAGLLAPIEETLARVLAEAQAPGSTRVVLRGPSGTGARRLFRKMVEQLNPPLVLHVSGVPGGLEPLGSLRLSLLHQWGSEEAVLAAFASLSAATLELIRQVVRGEVVEFHEAEGMLMEMLDGGPTQPGKSVVLLDPIGGVDPTTLTLLNSVIENPGAETVLVARLADEGRVPAAIAANGVVEFALPRLSAATARALAATVLGESERSGLAGRVAALGGDTPLGVIEAARTLVASGDLIHRDGHFTWRLAPPANDGAVPLERLLADRLRGVDATAHRMLEVVCVTPPGSGVALMGRVAHYDGVRAPDQRAALEALEQSWFLDLRTEWRPTSEQLRHVVLGSMPPSRRAELYRFLSQAILKDGPVPIFAGASLAYYVAEGGDLEAGAKGLLTASVAAADTGHLRAALRLAAAAVQFLPNQDTRRIAAHVSNTIKNREREGRSTRTSIPGETADTGNLVGSAATVRAIQAIVNRDWERAERNLELAIAQGRDLGGADRLRAVAAMARGNLELAHEAHRRVLRTSGDNPGARARVTLTLALIRLHEGKWVEAVRECLRALGLAKAARDGRGEAAVLVTLAACYRALGRAADTDALLRAAVASRKSA